MSFGVFRRQLAAELLKAQRRSLFHGTLVVLLVFSVLPMAIAYVAWRDPTHRGWAVDWVTFPGCLWRMLRYSQSLLPMLIAVVAAGSVGGEYAAGTWKMLLPRTPHRASALAARMLASGLLGMVGVGIGCLAAIGFGALGSALLGVPFLSASRSLPAGVLLSTCVFFGFELVLVVSLSTLCVVLTRSLVGGTLLAILVPVLLRMLSFLPGGWFLPMAHLDALEHRWVPSGRFKEGEVASVLGALPSWQVSALLVLLFSLVCTAAAAWVFGRRDMAAD